MLRDRPTTKQERKDTLASSMIELERKISQAENKLKGQGLAGGYVRNSELGARCSDSDYGDILAESEEGEE